MEENSDCDDGDLGIVNISTDVAIKESYFNEFIEDFDTDLDKKWGLASSSIVK